MHSRNDEDDVDTIKEVLSQSERQSGHFDRGALLNASMNTCVSQGSQMADLFPPPIGGKYQGKQSSFEISLAQDIPHSNRQAD